MQSPTIKIVLAALVISAFVGGGIYFWQTSQPQPETPATVVQLEELKTYSADSFTVQYPSSYQVSTDNLDIVTISGANGKIRIGKSFEPAAGPSPEGMTPEQIDEFPKDIVYHGYEGEVASALFYDTGDTATMNELKAIQESIELK